MSQIKKGSWSNFCFPQGGLANRRSFQLLIPLFLFLAITFILLNYVIPPYQNPDEPMHFVAIMINVKGEGKAALIEKEIISQMDRFSWWRYLGMGRPAELPSKLVDIPFLTQNYVLEDLRARLNNLVVYHWIMTWLLRGLGGRDISLSKAYYYLRFFSALFFMITIFLFARMLPRIASFPSFRGTGLSQKESSFVSLQKDAAEPAFLEKFVTLSPLFFMAFLPQVLISSLAVSPDAFCLFLGSAFFVAGFNLIQRIKPGLNLMLVYLIALIGLFTDRSLFIFIFLAGLISLFLINKKNWQKSVPLAVAFIFLGVICLYVLVLLFPFQMESSFFLVKNATSGGLKVVKQLFSLNAFNLQFIQQLADSFLVCFGWMAFRAGKGVYWVWRILIFISLIGLLIALWRLGWCLIRKKKGQRTEDVAASAAGQTHKAQDMDSDFNDSRTEGSKTPAGEQLLESLNNKSKNINNGIDFNISKIGVVKTLTFRQKNIVSLKIILFSLASVALQVMAIYAYYGRVGSLPQGRYLFPLIVPIVLLLVTGWLNYFSLFSERFSKFALILIIILAFVFLNYLIWAEMVPTYHFTIKSPYPGL